MTQYASGKYALGTCDRCGFTYKLLDLRYETTPRGQPTVKVCKTCWDPIHPQDVPPTRVSDAQALRDSRPDTGLGDSRVVPGGIIPTEDL